MAHVLTNIRLHQALHGYADGHRLLATSVSLKPRDQKTMLVMSDASGPSAVIGDTGYVTGYPLTDSGVYAIACTWPATEISRPGCVWTHTLLIDFADLAVLRSMYDFQTIFMRPSVKLDLQCYEHPLAFKYGPQRPNLSASTLESLKRVLWALYESPKAKIIATGDDMATEIALSIWAQQWPRLRRTFRFCTLSFGDRSDGGSFFDLQFVPRRDRSIRLRFTDIVDADKREPSNTPWMFEALRDLSNGIGGALRDFLREVGGDVTGGREAFAPLCQLYYLSTQVPENPEALDQMIGLLETGFDTETASSLRALIILTAVRHFEGVDKGRVIDFLLEHIDSLNPEALNNLSAQLGRVLWSRDPTLMIDLFDQTAPRPFIAEQALTSMIPSQLIEGFRRQPAAIIKILQRRPELLTETELWQIPGRWISEALRIASRGTVKRDAVLAALIAANRSDIAGDVANVFGDAQLLSAVASNKVANLVLGDMAEWLSGALSNSSTVAEVLSTNGDFGATFLAAIARRTQPDFVPNDYGDDPWWTAVRRCSAETDESRKQYLSAYLFVRALGHRSRNQAELLEYAFDAIYIPALQSRLSGDAWNLLDRRLPNSWFVDWDNCRRIRDAVVDAFIQRDLSFLGFARITRDDRVFEELAKLAERTVRGRRFLKRVLQSLKTINPESSRIPLLEDILD